MTGPERERGWSARAVLAAVACCAILAGLQVALPLSVLRSERPIGFGWHMYAHGPDRVRFEVVGPDGRATTFEDHELVARRRPELRPERWAPTFLCSRVPGALEVRIKLEGEDPRVHRCGD